MKFDLVAPCDNCPFLREGGIRLHPARAREIAEAQTDNNGASFICHKTAGQNADGDNVEVPTSQYCGGALVFQTKLGLFNQPVRIAGRLGLWDQRQVKLETFSSVFGSVLEMVYAQTERPLPRGKRPLKKTTPKRRSI